MELQNDRGTPVDPVPFFLVSVLSFLVCFTFGPPYWLALGFPLTGALGLSTAVFACAGVVAYYRLVWKARPELRGEVPGPVRFKRLVYLVFVLMAVVVLLTLPLLIVA